MPSNATRTTPMLAVVSAFAVSLAFAAACDSDSDGDADDGPPAAPEMLTAEELGGGAHLKWVDASDNETEFMIMKMDVTAGGAYEMVTTVPFDTTQYHDAPLTSGSTYMFMVMAINDAGMSESNEVEFTLP